MVQRSQSDILCPNLIPAISVKFLPALARQRGEGFCLSRQFLAGTLVSELNSLKINSGWGKTSFGGEASSVLQEVRIVC